MTKFLLVLVGAVTLTWLTADAQNPTPAGHVESPAARNGGDSEANYVLALLPASKEAGGCSFIVTNSQTFGLSRAGFTFNGTLNRTESGGFRLDYLLETADPHEGTVRTGSSVILRLGETVQLVKNGEQFFNIRIDHYPPVDAAHAAPSATPAR